MESLSQALFPDHIFVFDKEQLSREIMSVPDGSEFAAPPEVVQRNIFTLNHWIETWGMNMVLNAPAILSDYDYDVKYRIARRKRGSEYATNDAARQDLCVICGSGPSLEDNLEFLRRFPGIIIAAPTNLMCLAAHGIFPHYCLAVDASNEVSIHVERAAAIPGMGKTKLLLPITIAPETVAAWPWERYWHLDFIQGGHGLSNPFNSFQCAIYPWIELYLTQAGCVTNSALMLPFSWGLQRTCDIKKVFLLGCDFGFPQGKARIGYYTYDAQDKTFSRIEPHGPGAKASSPLRLSANGIPSEEAQLGYKRSLLTVWSITHYQVGAKVYGLEDRVAGLYHLYSCSEGILEDVLPHFPASQALLNPDSLPLYDHKFVIDSYNRYIREIAPKEGQGDAEGNENG